ncbi:MAG: tetratricopeptide repeat protein [Blastocatellia bacterium]|nr:tetratricopeptide repeat protein [Blastocatellia bacterium]
MRKLSLIVLILLVLPVSVTLSYQGAKRPAQNRPGAKPQAGAAANRFLPKPAPDPTRATQTELDAALFVTEEFFGTQARAPRPYAQAREQLTPLVAKYPQDVRLLRYTANLDEKLGNFDRAVEEMRQYSTLRKDAPNALRRLAAFYHQRAMYADEARTLQKLSPVALPFERPDINTQIGKLVAEHTLSGFDLAEFYKQSMLADPTNLKLVEQYVGQLATTRKYLEALRVLDELQPKYPDNLQYFLKTRAGIYEAQQDRRGAENVYAATFSPLWPRAVVADYYDLLRKYGRYRTYRRELQDGFPRSKGREAFQAAGRLFNLYAYEANLGQAVNVLQSFEQKRSTPAAGDATPWNNQELETCAALYLQIGRYDQAARFLYSLYLGQGLTPGSAGREKTLASLATTLLDAQNTGIPLSATDLTLYSDIASVDEGAGFLNGVLSLVLAGNNPPAAFKSAKNGAVAYYNRALAYRFYAALKTEYPTSTELAGVHVKLLDAFAALGEQEAVIRLGDEFLKQFPTAKNYREITLKIADAEVTLNRREAERTRLLALLDRIGKERPATALLLPVSARRWVYKGTDQQAAASEGGESEEPGTPEEVYDPADPNATDAGETEYETFDYPTDYLGNQVTKPEEINYGTVLERVVSSYAAENKPLDTLKFFNGEIKKYPREEGLYERMLRWLGQTSMVDEQVQLYTQAVKRFNSNTWYHRLARWFVRNERQDAFEKYSKELAEILDDGDLGEYFERFINNADLNGGGNDARLYLELYRFAHDRFPTNAEFVQGLLKYHAATQDWVSWEPLAAQYSMVDTDIREQYFRRLSQTNALRKNYQTARTKGASPLYKRFSADAAMWLSHHDEALETYRELVKAYPGEPQFAERLANMTRSFGSTSAAAAEEAAKTWMDLAKVYPAEHKYPTQAGEVLAELGDFKRAGAEWDTILKEERGNSETYLEVASIYWDYFLYDEAIRTLTGLRTATNNPTAYAYQMGALYEGKNQMERAIAEYVAETATPGDTRDKAITRLKQLYPRKDYAGQIAKAFAARQNQLGKADDGQTILAYAKLLGDLGQPDAGTGLLKQEMQSRGNLDFLEAIRTEFHRTRRLTEEEQTLKQMLTVARDERENMKYRLQLASFYEQQARIDNAVAMMDNLVADYPTNVGVLQEASQFYWRTGLLDKSITLYQRSSGKAVGAYKRQFILQLAKRQTDAGKLDDAEKTLRGWYTDNPLDTEVFGLLTKTLGEAGKTDALAELYKIGLKNIADANLDSDERRTATANLRLGLIETLKNLKRGAEAIDQHIEIINRDPENPNVLNAAIADAVKLGQLDRLTKYYVDLAKQADRNYRWNVVLGELNLYNGKVAEAADQYRLATVNEPQRLDFRGKLAGLYERQGKTEEAVATLKRAYELDPGNPDWLVRLAKLYLRQEGGKDRAVTTLREALAARKQTDAMTYFSYGEVLLNAGLTKESLSFFDDGIARIKTNPYKNQMTQSYVAMWASVTARTSSPLAALSKLEAFQKALLAEGAKKGNVDPETPKNKANQVGEAIRTDFPTIVRNFATPEQMLELEGLYGTTAATETDTKKLTDLADWAGKLGLTPIQERSLIRLKDAAWQARKKNTETQFHGQMQQLVAFYEARENFGAVIELLKAEAKREKFPGTFNYDQTIAEAYRKAGDGDGELAALNQFYRNQSGDLVTSENGAVARYLNLLKQRNRRSELEALARMRSPFQLQLINFLLRNREKELARTAIANSGLTQAWVQSRSAQVELYFRNAAPEVGKMFQQVLGIRPIGERVGKKPNLQTELAGTDWYRTARNYGAWLSLDAKRSGEMAKYLMAEAESNPTSDTTQRSLADFYRQIKQYDRAKAHIALARELAFDEPENMAVEGSILFESGDKKGALAAWNRMIAPRRTSSDVYVRYLDLMTDYGLTAEALPPLETWIMRRLQNTASETEDEWTPILKSLTETTAQNPSLVKPVSAMYQRILDARPDDLRFGKVLFEENLMPKGEETALYRRLCVNLPAEVVTAYSNSDYDFDSYSSDNPADLLANVQKRWIDQLIGAQAYAEAEKQLAEMLKTRQLLFGQLRDPREGEYDPDRYDPEPEWMTMARAVVELRTNRTAQALERLRRFTGIVKKEGDTEPPNEAYLHAYALLVNENHQAEADDLARDHYQQQLGGGYLPSSVYGGLAEVEFRRGKTAEGLAQLKRMTDSSETPDVLKAAADIAARFGQFAPAVEWRKRAQKQTPADVGNRLELARLQERNQQAEAALTTLGDVIDDRNTANAQRLTALELLGDIARRNAAAGNSLLARFKAKTDLTSQTAAAVLLEAAGNGGEARNVLDRVTQAPYTIAARIERGQQARREKQAEAAIQAFMAALRDDPGSTQSAGLAFSDGQPKRALMALYLDTNRDEAALRLAGTPAADTPPETKLASFTYTEVRPTATATLYGSLEAEGQNRDRQTQRQLYPRLAESAAAGNDLYRAIAFVRAALAVTDTSSPDQGLFEKQIAQYETRRQQSVPAVSVQSALTTQTDLASVFEVALLKN